MINSDSNLLVTGASGFLGQHVVTELKKNNYSNIELPQEKACNLLNIEDCKKAVLNVDAVVNIAGKVGSTVDNMEYPGSYFYENALAGMNILEASRLAKVNKFIQLGTVISYPLDLTNEVAKEEMLWSGYPDETKEGYAMAKKLLYVMGKTYRQQYKMNVVHLLMANMYGPGDHFESKNSHVIPALIDRFWNAVNDGVSEVVVWGTGKATRDFLYVSDAAKAILHALQVADSDDPINIVSGQEVSIKKITETIANQVGFQGDIVWDSSKPDGQLKSAYDNSNAYDLLNWKSETDIEKGITKTVNWYLENIRNAEVSRVSQN